MSRLLEAGKMDRATVSFARQKGIPHQVTETERATNLYTTLYERPVLFSEECTGKLVRSSHCPQELRLPNNTQPT